MGILSWRFLRMQLQSDDIVEMIWTDEDGEHRSILRVDYDIDGASFHTEGGPAPDEDTIGELDHDMSMLAGSEFIPVRPRYYKAA